MPSMDGLPAGYCQFMHTTEYRNDTASDLGSATRSDTKFGDRLLHDAESRLWVIAWTLGTTMGAGTTLERCSATGSEIYWNNILHSDLHPLSGMLAKMHVYVRPEWTHRPELNPEHRFERPLPPAYSSLPRRLKPQHNSPIEARIPSNIPGK
ncbi:hypothetical protein RSAG8_10382, partial [Rhizoctonia solani AG-8 WAC10335]